MKVADGQTQWWANSGDHFSPAAEHLDRLNFSHTLTFTQVAILLRVLDLEGTTALQNMNCLTDDTASHPGKLEFSTSL